MKLPISNAKLLELKEMINRLKRCRTINTEERRELQFRVDLLMKTYFPEQSASTFIRTPVLTTIMAR